jgi:hypothetical protein
MRSRLLAATIAGLLLVAPRAFAQDVALAQQLAELASLSDKVGNADTRVRVAALHRVWILGTTSGSPQVKLSALGLLTEPVGSSSDHIRMPAVYAIVDIANSTSDAQVKIRALGTLREPLDAGQVPIRDVAVDAVNWIAGRGAGPEVALAAVSALASPVRSGNNGVRIPAINAVVRAVEGGRDDRACQAALDALTAPLESEAMIGGLEVRMMAVWAVERVGIAATEVGAKAKAMGLLQTYAAKGSWEPEARARAQQGAAAIENSFKR